MRIIVCLLLLGAASGQAESKGPESPVGFIKGYSWGWTGSRGAYRGDAPDHSLELLASTSTKWIALAFSAHMRTKNSPEVLYAKSNPLMVSDKEILRAIELARKHRLKVIMKPVVNCRDGAWRATIDFETEEAWDKWWESYEGFLLHYAKIAADTKCEMLCIGCELRSTQRFQDRWRRLIGKVRKTYQGPLTYNANHDDCDHVNWYDAVDVIGVSAYWSVAVAEDTSLERMLDSWKPVRERLSRLSKQWKKPILCMEIGVRSASTCSTMPWDWSRQDLPYDGQEQARYYEAAFRSLFFEDWCIGFCWWDWPARLYTLEQAEKNTGFCVYGKPAEKVLRHWYSKSR